MRIEVRLFGPLKRYLPQNAVGQRTTLELDNEATVEELLRALNIGDIECVITANDSPVSRSHKLNDGDVVGIYPPIAGG
ncbi:MAG: MoaD/ThiS family protein [Armatimonadota bacterium]|nr:MoaD/ThiS family protein [Armatimonadota bacterium]MCX7777736.1 MoaD/ThiS family protein [Armatimonadota bacterium]MDW8026209.1 MoaD/ThiS family protein [Armatimonadota bacterium]